MHAHEDARKRAVDVAALKGLMGSKGFRSVGALADASGIGRTTLGKILNGDMQPSTCAMLKLMDALDIPEDQAGQIFFAFDLRET